MLVECNKFTIYASWYRSRLTWRNPMRPKIVQQFIHYFPAFEVSKRDGLLFKAYLKLTFLMHKHSSLKTRWKGQSAYSVGFSLFASLRVCLCFYLRWCFSPLNLFLVDTTMSCYYFSLRLGAKYFSWVSLLNNVSGYTILHIVSDLRSLQSNVQYVTEQTLLSIRHILSTQQSNL